MPLAGLSALMRQRDAEARVLPRLANLREQARKALLALEHQRAATLLTEAARLGGAAFLRFYEPRVLADLHLLAGTLELQRTRPDLANEHFAAALHLWPRLALDAHHSPQVRRAFAAARRTLPPRPAPGAPQLAAVTALDSRIRYALVLVSEKATGGMVLAKALFFDPHVRAYTTVESVGVLPASARSSKELAAFGDRVRTRAGALFPRVVAAHSQPSTQPASRSAVPVGQLGGRLGPEHEGEHRRDGPTPHVARWYRRWYVWAALAVVVGGAVAIPLLTRSSTVDIGVQWR